jgi:nucleoside-diphosphate-sugar epimerase
VAQPRHRHRSRWRSEHESALSSHARSQAHAGTRRHRQDRPPRGGAPHRARPAGSHRLEVALPAGDTLEPFVDADDIADVAVAALTDDRHIGELYELTGPRLLTFAEAVAEIGRATGREVRYVPISVEDFAAAAAEQGVPREVVEMLTFIFGEVLDGRNAHLADGVQRALGREPRDFSDYARDAAATSIWNPTPTTALTRA